MILRETTNDSNYILSLKNSTEDDLNRYGLKIDKNSHEFIQFSHALNFIEKIDFSKIKKIADIGSGPGHQSYIFNKLGLDVTCIDFRKPKYDDLKWIHPSVLKDYMLYFDAIWSHHCLEHISDSLSELVLWNKLLRNGGYLFLTVPEISSVISSGHITNYSIPLLIYHLAMAGFDCSDSCFDISGYQIRAKVKKQTNYSPHEKMITSLKELASYKLFPKSVEMGILKTDRIKTEDIVLKFFDEVKKPVKCSSYFCNFVFNSLWK